MINMEDIKAVTRADQQVRREDDTEYASYAL